MVLKDEGQIRDVWDAFADAGFQYASDSGEVFALGTANEERRERLPVRRRFLQEFLDGEMGAEDLRSEMASESGQHKLWGYSGTSGGMFFNMLLSAAESEDDIDLQGVLREVLVAPGDGETALEYSQQLEEVVEELRARVANPQQAPQTGYIPYFLSYFWQLQEPDTYPIYYRSMRDALRDIGEWTPSGDIAKDYVAFWELNEEIRSVLDDHAEREIHLWTIERMFLFWNSREDLTDTELTDEQVEILRQWVTAAGQVSQARHFDFVDKYTPSDARDRAAEFVSSPDRETFEALWDPMHSAQRAGSADVIYQKWTDEYGRSAEELAEVIGEMRAAEEYDESWEQRLGAKRTIWELFGLLHIEEFPILNGSTERGLGFFGYDCPRDYEGCVEQFNTFKSEYGQMVGRVTEGTAYEVPLNYEIDQLLNVIDKVGKGDPAEESHSAAAELYKTVLEAQSIGSAAEYDGIEEAVTDIRSRLSVDGVNENWVGEIILGSVVREWTEVFRRNDLGEGDIASGDVSTVRRILELYRNNETRLEEQSEELGSGWVPPLTRAQTLFVVLLRELQSQAGVESPNFDQVQMAGILDGGFGEDTPEPLAASPTRPADAERIERQLKQAHQLVFHGPPGTGKTYTAQRFARWWLSKETEHPTESQLETVTFHPSFTYEDFIEGLTAEKSNGGVEYKIKSGVFKRICDRARSAYQDAGADAKPYVLIIDEINRGNLAQIFGETITLLENDKRLGAENETVVTLPHSKTEFTVPPNIYVIGTMNTADRSIALVDAALRRRFRFIAFPPDYEVLYDEYGFGGEKAAETAASSNQDLDTVLQALSIKALHTVNEAILDAPDLGKGKQIGHSYLLGVSGPQEAVDAWKYDILPLLDEYYFGQFERIRQDIFHGAGTELLDWERERIRDFDAFDLVEALATLTDVEPEGSLQIASSSEGESESYSTYPGALEAAQSEIFPRIKDMLHADVVSEVSSTEYDRRALEFTSQHPDHPEEITYLFKPAPERSGSLAVRLHTKGEDDQHFDFITQNAGQFEEEGFDVRPPEDSATTYRVVTKEYDIEDVDRGEGPRIVEELRGSELFQKAIDDVVDLVEITHSLYTETQGRKVESDD
ncbi:McrB family protein [Natronomonas salsuginis]|nr:AAA family ATPase [Natronomonas salsuginis]